MDVSLQTASNILLISWPQYFHYFLSIYDQITHLIYYTLRTKSTVSLTRLFCLTEHRTCERHNWLTLHLPDYIWYSMSSSSSLNSLSRYVAKNALLCIRLGWTCSWMTHYFKTLIKLITIHHSSIGRADDRGRHISRIYSCRPHIALNGY